MRTSQAMAMGDANRGKSMMVFDWDKAAQLIKETKPETASAGLYNDWEYTGGTIFCNGIPCFDDYTYLNSTWATPELDIDGNLSDCFIMEDEAAKRWGDVDFAKLKWPQSALDILSAKPLSRKAEIILSAMLEGTRILNSTIRLGVKTIEIKPEIMKELIDSEYIAKIFPAMADEFYISTDKADNYLLELLNA